MPEQHVSSTFKLQAVLLRLLDPEEGGVTTFEKIGNCIYIIILKFLSRRGLTSLECKLLMYL